MAFPSQRLRRLRSTPTLRNMVRETWLTSNDFIYPLFVVYGETNEYLLRQCPEYFNIR